MPIWMDVDIAIELFVNSDPLVASGDGFTIDEGIAYNESGMDLNWNFQTPAGVVTQTNVVPTTAGEYDWAHVGNGMYKIEMTASGGASIDNDVEGFGWFTGKCDAVLPWRSPTYGFRAAALNDALIEGGDNLDVNVVQWLAQAVTLSAGNQPDVNVDRIDDVAVSTVATAGKLHVLDDEGNTVANESKQDTIDGIVDNILTDTGTTLDTLIKDIPTVAEFEARTIVSADYTVTGDLGTVQSGDSFAIVNGTHGLVSIQDDIDSILVDTAVIGVLGAGLTNIPWNSSWDAEVQSEVNDALVVLKLDHLVAVADADDVVDNSIIAKLAAKGATADWSDFVNTTESLQALRDRGDAAWVTGGTGSGATSFPYTVTVGGVGIADAFVWVTSDEAGTVTVASGLTNSSGIVTFNLDLGVTYWFWTVKDGYNFDVPDEEVID